MITRRPTTATDSNAAVNGVESSSTGWAGPSDTAASA